MLDTLTKSAAQLCEADIAAIIRQKGDAYCLAEKRYGLPHDSGEYAKANVAIEPRARDRCGPRVARGKTVQVAELFEDREYRSYCAKKPKK